MPHRRYHPRTPRRVTRTVLAHLGPRGVLITLAA